MSELKLSSGVPHQMGAVPDGDGVNFAVFSENATKIELCLFDEASGTETKRITLPERTGGIWHGHVAGIGAGQVYGYRAHGAYAPESGHRFNPHKLLLDPYTRELRGEWKNDPALLGFKPNASKGDLSMSKADSAPYVAKSVVTGPALFSDVISQAAGNDTADLIYEAHVKGLTQLHPNVPEDLRGTYEGLASEPMLEHLQKLGVKSIELMPVHSLIDDAFLLDRGLTNYWGYNSVGFFAAEPRYFGPAGLIGFRQMVDRFHKAGIEVILDVVYNHTAEGDHRGPTLSFRGLDNANYYRLIAGQPRYYVNDTGTGNTVNVSHPNVLRLVLDSLRFWVSEMGIDGFRFDLATTLGREDHGFDPNGGFFDALRQDPVLAKARMIAEPWDIGPGGYQLGGYPPEWSEWNDQYRDTVRRYWRGDAQSTQDLSARLLGSADRFDRAGRRSTASVNLVAAHDGFTLADTTRYSEKHNQANGEGNQDGHHANFSDNCGVEGDTDDPVINARRRRRQRNMLATLFLSQGTPMLLAGDELSNSQAGNNNAYCQDNEIGWVNWEDADEGLQSFVATLSRFRQDHPALRQTRFLHGAKRKEDGQPDVVWTGFDGEALQWRDPSLSNFCLTLRCSAEAPKFESNDDVVVIAFNRSTNNAFATLPDDKKNRAWTRALDTAAMEQPRGATPEDPLAHISANSVAVFIPIDGPN